MTRHINPEATLGVFGAFRDAGYYRPEGPRTLPACVRMSFAKLAQFDADRGNSFLPLIKSDARQRWEANGISLNTADHIAVKGYGVHPISIWGDDWFADIL